MIYLKDLLPFIINYCNGAELFSLENTSKSIKKGLKLKVFKPSDSLIETHCQKCNKNNLSNNNIYIYLHRKWSSCNNCLPQILYSRTKYIQQFQNLCDKCFISCELVEKFNFKFYRKSKNIIQKNAIIYKTSCEFLLNCLYPGDKNNMLSQKVCWNIYVRCVSLQNLIHYNRSLYGYSLEEFPFRINNSIVNYITIEILNKRIKKSYNLANEFYILSLCLKKKKLLNTDLLKIIYSYWRYFIF